MSVKFIYILQERLMNIKNILLFIISSILVIACKAKIVELDTKAKNVFAAVDGEDGVRRHFRR
jgi:hypothetical protein